MPPIPKGAPVTLVFGILHRWCKDLRCLDPSDALHPQSALRDLGLYDFARSVQEIGGALRAWCVGLSRRWAG